MALPLLHAGAAESPWLLLVQKKCHVWPKEEAQETRTWTGLERPAPLDTTCITTPAPAARTPPASAFMATAVSRSGLGERTNPNPAPNAAPIAVTRPISVANRAVAQAFRTTKATSRPAPAHSQKKARAGAEAIR